MPLKPREIAELVVIASVAAGAAALSKFLPQRLPPGELLLAASALLLVQGLIRDLLIKFAAHSRTPAKPGSSQIICLCAESTIGIVGIIAGIALLLAGTVGTHAYAWPFSFLTARTIALPRFFWSYLIAITGLVGFFLKDIVIDWKARRLRRETDHSSVRFW